MAQYTKNLRLEKPELDELYDINVANNNMDIIDGAVTDIQEKIKDTLDEVYIGDEASAPQDAKIVVETDYINDLGSEVVNSLDGNESNKAPSVRAVKEALGNQYSEDEQIIGTWIDGKPIYRKVVNIGTLPNSTRKEIAHGISNLGQIVNFKGTFYNSNYSAQSTLPYVASNPSPNFFSYQIAMDIDSNNIIVLTYYDYSVYTAHVIIEYTKTID